MLDQNNSIPIKILSAKSLNLEYGLTVIQEKTFSLSQNFCLH